MARGRPPNLARNEARAAGLKTYDAAEPCWCGCVEFYVSNGRCRDCTIAAAQAHYRALAPEALAELKAKDRGRYVQRLLRKP